VQPVHRALHPQLLLPEQQQQQQDKALLARQLLLAVGSASLRE
jgi:hypothetical protein